MRSLPVRLEDAARPDRGVTFVNADDADHVSYAELHRQALLVAGALQSRGIGTGSHVALLGPTTRRLVTTIRAVWMTGATLVVLPLPMRLGSLDDFIEQTRLRIRQADITLVVADPDLAPFIEATRDDPPMVLFSDLEDERLGSAAYEPVEPDPDGLAVLQFTSGSTASPKGVMLPQRTISSNLDAIAEAAQLDRERDVMVSWLPLYHDMGLVGFCMLPMTTGVDLVLGAPQDFMARPLRWMEWISAHGGTATAGPNFSWALAARALGQTDSHLDLSSLRIALNGAEPIDPDSVRALVAAGEPHGLRPGAVFPAFGMAEVVIGAAFPEPMSGMRTDIVDKVTLEAEHYAAPAPRESQNARELAILGRPLPGMAFRIVDPETGSELGERAVGELELAGTSVTPGYWKRPDANRELFHDGWLRTGDLAYLVDGELVMCGRLKDLIIVGGRNVYPQDVERAVAECDGVRAGNVIAFGVEGRAGREELVVVAETRDDDVIDLRARVGHRVRSAVGVPPKHVVLVPPGTVPKTSSGKLQRTECKQQYIGNNLPPEI